MMVSQSRSLTGTPARWGDSSEHFHLHFLAPYRWE